jgi:hypothetical protein
MTIQNAVWTHRRKCNTTFILKAAINNPNVIIVFLNKRLAKDEGELYYTHLTSKLNIIQKLFLKKINLKFFKNPINYPFFKTPIKPLFISVSELEKIRGCDRALIFDNSCFA